MRKKLRSLFDMAVYPFYKLFEKDKYNKFIINCGGHRSKYLQDLRKEFDPKNEFFIHTFEPNPVYAKGYKYFRKQQFHQKAVWVHDGIVKLYTQDNEKSQGHSLCEKKRNISTDKFIEVECIDFGKWIKDNFTKEDYLIVRMDIEGAEFKVLDSIINDGSIEYFDKLSVEFHHRKYPEIASNEEYLALTSKIKIPFEEIAH